MQLNLDINYLIKCDFELTNEDYLIVFYLYRPIISNYAYIFYLMLVYDCSDYFKIGDNVQSYNLQYFSKTLQLTANRLVKVFKELEVIGLLKIIKRDDCRCYVLEPQLPASANLFFLNSVFSEYLSEKIGLYSFELLKKRFLITNNKNVNYFDSSKVSKFVGLIDFVEINKCLSKRNIDSKLYSYYIDNIISLISVYNIDIRNEDIVRLIYESVDVKDKYSNFNFIKFKLLLSDFYQRQDLIKKINVERLNLVIDNENNIVPSNVKEIKIKEMATIDSIEYLTLLRNNTKPTIIEINIIRDLILDYHLKSGVVNCLIEYVCFKNNNRIERVYCEKIARTFSQLNIDTVRKAMEHLKNAHINGQKKLVFKKAFSDKKKFISFRSSLNRDLGFISYIKQDIKNKHISSISVNNNIDNEFILNELKKL